MKNMIQKLFSHGIGGCLLVLGLALGSANAALAQGATVIHGVNGVDYYSFVYPITETDYVAVTFPANSGDIVRINPDGSIWFGAGSNEAEYAILRPKKGDLNHSWDTWPKIYVGTGFIQFTYSAFLDGLMLVADEKRINFDLQATVHDPNSQDGQEFKFVYKLIMTDGEVNMEKLSLSPL
jgi:hypothetical protein